MGSANEKIFKAYDIRGIYPQELDEATAELIGRAYVQIAGVEKIAVGRDMRLGSNALSRAFIKGATESGCNVDDIGLVPVDEVYFAVGRFDYDGGVMVTASHNPKEYCGFKMVNKYGDVIRGTDIKDLVRRGSFTKAAKPGKVAARNLDNEYIGHVLSFVDLPKIKPLKIVADAGNGMAGKVLPQLAPYLPVEIIPLFFELDGSFPNRSPNPLEPDATKRLIETVKKEKADLGVIFDGDTDRLFFIDELGNFIRADITLLILAKHFLRLNPGATIIYNAICSKAVPELIKEWRGKAVRSPVGYVNVRKAMIENKALMGGELSAHYSFKDNFFADSGFIAMLLVLQLVSEAGQPLSKIAKEYAIYHKANEINIKVADAAAKIEAVKKKYSDGKQDFLDGITVEYPDWWLNVRPSNTEPLLRITIEADTPELLDEKIVEVANFIKVED